MISKLLQGFFVYFMKIKVTGFQRGDSRSPGDLIFFSLEPGVPSL